MLLKVTNLLHQVLFVTSLIYQKVYPQRIALKFTGEVIFHDTKRSYGT
jgi:hypothetical protein